MTFGCRSSSSTMTFGRCSNQLSGPILLIIRALLHPGSFHGLNKKAPQGSLGSAASHVFFACLKADVRLNNRQSWAAPSGGRGYGKYYIASSRQEQSKNRPSRRGVLERANRWLGILRAAHEARCELVNFTIRDPGI